MNVYGLVYQLASNNFTIAAAVAATDADGGGGGVSVAR
jgi:hypothetical protein